MDLDGVPGLMASPDQVQARKAGHMLEAPRLAHGGVGGRPNSQASVGRPGQSGSATPTNSQQPPLRTKTGLSNLGRFTGGVGGRKSKK
jgi:hypothetical protein